MAISPSNIILYAADPNDFKIALATGALGNVPTGNVIGDFSIAYSYTQSETHLVIAVGGPALNALYYNPCGWGGYRTGSTPFSIASSPTHTLPGANHFINSAGNTALDTLYLTTVNVLYAINGNYPPLFPKSTMPVALKPTQTCIGNNPQTCPCDNSNGNGKNKASSSGGVGVYGAFGNESYAIKAIQGNWDGIGDTAAIGIKKSPYTQVLNLNPDQNVSSALDNYSKGDKFWLSFYTVSWPSKGDTFYNAGFQGGQVASKHITDLKGKYLPTYIVIDPEGYNTPASTASEWKAFISGWSDGIISINPKLSPGFYCDQSQYEMYNLASLNLPAFLAVSPIEGNKPHYSGGNIKGYIAYYASCPVSSKLKTVKSWGAQFNTVQFKGSGVDCSP